MTHALILDCRLIVPMPDAEVLSLHLAFHHFVASTPGKFDMMARTLPTKLQGLLDGNDQSLVEGVYEAITNFYDWSVEDDLPAAGTPVRVVGDVIEADFQIGEGGFHQLVTSHIADLTTILESYEAVGAVKAADTIRTVFARYPDSMISSDSETRYDLIERLGLHQHDEPDRELSTEYFRHAPQPWDFLAGYIRSHPVAFKEVFPVTDPDAPEDPYKIAERERRARKHADVAAFNQECQNLHETLTTSPHVCPRCSRCHVRFDCVLPEHPERKSYFVCKECGCSFDRDRCRQTIANDNN